MRLIPDDIDTTYETNKQVLSTHYLNYIYVTTIFIFFINERTFSYLLVIKDTFSMWFT